ncbi:hypothetical protein DES53_12040 [Roseimicrobium gellanilyticum]|uniref:Uncharacterized protein n=2 Tax=Roseimicrobium gellanilyticum TaxID=748857 RepID=A0A366H1B3_9BACT|nr:hypothetical protein DES53_12040 [Roseimicrobium gellanilyticum]
MVRSSHALGFPVGAYMTDLLTEKLQFQLIDHELQGKEFPEELEVAQLLRDAHSRGNRLMVLEIDPHSNKAAITKKFDGIFSRWYAGARVDRNYASKLASLGIALPKKLPKSRAKLNWQRLEELEILDGNDKLGFEKRRTFCRVFSQLPFG